MGRDWYYLDAFHQPHGPTESVEIERQLETADTVRLDRGHLGHLTLTDEVGGPLDGLNLVRRHFRPAATRAGLNPRLPVYDLWHTYATLLPRPAKSVRFASERLCHARR